MYKKDTTILTNIRIIMSKYQVFGDTLRKKRLFRHRAHQQDCIAVSLTDNERKGTVGIEHYLSKETTKSVKTMIIKRKERRPVFNRSCTWTRDDSVSF